ncbi:hypothetical protein [Belnapia rosea]|uniref:hypothetical protein n=1 Tax=Belnapia rosea TaxID=938405 RepID=UPI000B886CD5|nr:hypothetical protein [Belnapia rosea]
MRRALLPLLLLLGCASERQVVPIPFDSPAAEVSVPALGGLVRAGQACGVPLSAATLDRAARIETAAIEQKERIGGTAARDAFLHSMAPPDFGRGGEERDRWCAARRPEVERMNAILSGPAGAAMLQRAEIARALRR